MKRSVCILCMILACMLLCSCAAKKERLPLNDAVSAVMGSELNTLVAFTPDDLEIMADITPDEYTECVFLLSEDGLSACDVIVIRAKDQTAARGIADKLNNYLNQRRSETRDYLPDAYLLLSQAQVQTKGTTVALIVSEKAGEYTNQLFAGE